MRCISLITILILTACSNGQNKLSEQLDKSKYDSSVHLTNTNGIVHKNTNLFRQMRCGLYVNNAGEIAFKATDNSYKLDTTGKSKPFDVFIKTVWNTRPYDTIYESRDELKNIVDTATLTILDWEYFKDKKHVYHFTPMIDGGSLTIMDYADPNTFKVLESHLYAVDKKYCYYRGKRIKTADRKTFKVVDTSLAYHFAIDKNNYYDGELIMTKEDVKRHGLNINKTRL